MLEELLKLIAEAKAAPTTRPHLLKGGKLFSDMRKDFKKEEHAEIIRRSLMGMEVTNALADFYEDQTEAKYDQIFEVIIQKSLSDSLISKEDGISRAKGILKLR